MSRILYKPYTVSQYAEFSIPLLEKGYHIEETSYGFVGLAPYEKIIDGEVVDLSEDETYKKEQLDKLKQRAKLSINKAYENAIKFGIFPLGGGFYANCSWENMWQRVVNVYSNLPAIGQVPPETFKIRLYIKQDGIYKSIDKTDTTIQELKNMLTLLVAQVLLNYQPKRDVLFASLETYYKDADSEGINSLIQITENLGGFGDFVDEISEGNPEYV